MHFRNKRLATVPSQTRYLVQPVRTRSFSARVDASHLCHILSLLYSPGPRLAHALNERDFIEDSSTFARRGIWLLTEKEYSGEDEYGWVCINWPRLLSHFPYNYEISPYLRNHGYATREMQQLSEKAFLELHEGGADFKAALLQRLPPGALLKADNAFFRRLASTFPRPPDQKQGNNDGDGDAGFEENLADWTVFRFGALALGSKKSFEGVVNSHSPLLPLSMCKVDPELLQRCPDIIRTLFAVFTKARASDGQGWQKWGIAWTKRGLVFNYQIAMYGLEACPDLYASLFPEARAYVPAICGKWSNPAYAFTQPDLRGIPPLSAIMRRDKSTISINEIAVHPYKSLFQDSDREISNNATLHGSDENMLFPIVPNAKDTLLTYIKQLIKLSENKIAGQDVYNIATHVVPEVLKKPKAQPDPDSNYTRYRVGFNAYHIGSTEEPASAYTADRTYSMSVIPYRGYYYFGFPDQLIELLPVLNDRILYLPTQPVHQLQWFYSETGWQLTRLFKKHCSAGVKRVNTFTYNFTYPGTPDNRTPLSYAPGNHLHINPGALTPKGLIIEFLNECIAMHPGNDEERAPLANQIEVFKNFWGWVYDPEAGLKEGKYSEEFMYPLGKDTEHCPRQFLLNTPTKRMQFLVDKALHSNDPHVAFMPAKGTGSDARSKKPNGYDDFIFWYVAHHEIAKMPYVLDKTEQALYITKRWMPWRRMLSARNRLVNPYPEHPKVFEHPHIEEVFLYANQYFGKAFTQY